MLKGGESTPKLQSNHAAALGETAITMLALGDANGALALARQARDIYAQVLAGAPDDIRYIHDLALTDRTIGDILRRQGDLAGALAAYQQAQATIDQAPAKAKSDPQILGDQAEVSKASATSKPRAAILTAALESSARIWRSPEPWRTAIPRASSGATA